MLQSGKKNLDQIPSKQTERYEENDVEISAGDAALHVDNTRKDYRLVGVPGSRQTRT
ncbi:MAG: hypothetical protein ACXACI_14280 [Candidatus Hodarchaeales archaeon]